MAMEPKEGALTPEMYDEEVSKMGRPIPGQSMTNDPNNPEPYERAPTYTNVHEASEYLWEMMTEDTTYPKLMNAINQGVPVMALVEVLLFNEFQKGSFNPDLMLMMAEPAAYMLIALAERLDLDIQITDDDEDDEAEQLFGVEVEEEKLERLRQSVTGNAPASVITPSMKEEMNALPEISLLSQAQDDMAGEPVEEEAPSQQPSLMAPPEGQ